MAQDQYACRITCSLSQGDVGLHLIVQPDDQIKYPLSGCCFVLQQKITHDGMFNQVDVISFVFYSLSTHSCFCMSYVIMCCNSK